ncbi:hemolysin family protein [Embleya sp. NBC_00896]|uniref:hemolysin family protein n=1 Tax=Embleya sp. NBC_00896 TaxID=2975961 RepID=UPI003865C6FD|nr:hemolysin family protein [Embleya sp. NBC_00896]
MLLVILIAGNGMFVAAEFSLVTVERSDVEARARAGDRGAARVLRAVRTLSFQLSGAQLGITVTSLIAGYLAEAAFRLPRFAALVLASALQMVLGELVPKNAAIARPLGVARVAGPFQVGFSRVCKPLIVFLNGSANYFVRRLGIEPQDELGSARSADELAQLVRHSAREGALPAGTARVLDRALRFGAKQAAEAMTPRTELVTLPATASVTELLDTARLCGHSRIPVRGEDLDEIVGVAVVRDALRVPAAERADTPLARISRDPVLVPTSLDLKRVVERLREGRTQLAIVVDEYGGTAGVLTAEDLAEELVGDLADEHDPADEPDGPPVQRQPRTRVLRLSGLLRADEVEEASGWRMPDGDYSTLAGLVLAHLGHLPRVGEHVDVDGHRLTVVTLDRHRIDEVELRMGDES